jgi:hypothetical protein
VLSEVVLLESKTLRANVVRRTDVLDKVRVLAMLPDRTHVTTAMVADYFEVGIKAIRSMVVDHREELEANGYRVLTGTELSSFKELSYIQSPIRHLAIFPRRAVLNVAMLLRDSEIARQVRTYLLDTEFAARTTLVDNPVDNPVDDFVHRDTESLDRHIDNRIANVLGSTVVPMFNALIETAGEQRADLFALRRDVRRLERSPAMRRQRLSDTAWNISRRLPWPPLPPV